MANNLKPIRVGSRKSELALIQTKHVISRLQRIYPEKKFEIHAASHKGLTKKKKVCGALKILEIISRKTIGTLSDIKQRVVHAASGGISRTAQTNNSALSAGLLSIASTETVITSPTIPSGVGASTTLLLPKTKSPMNKQRGPEDSLWEFHNIHNFPFQQPTNTMTTIGDRVLNISLPKIGEKSLFTRDLEDALRNGGVDFVVHSLKDLPTSLPTGMAIGAVLEREDARDALVLSGNFKGFTMDTLPAGSVIGTSSLRRTAQLRRKYPHLVVSDIRGNLNTRLAKLDASDSKYVGIILAQAGLVRMGWNDRVTQVLEPSDVLYAVGQGALAVECRANDNDILDMLRSLMCLSTSCRILAERSFLKTLGGGCSAPVAVCSKLHGELLSYADCSNVVKLHLDGAVWSLDGCTEIRDKIVCCLALNDEETPIESDDGSNQGPPTKRAKITNSAVLSPQDTTPIINDDADVKDLAGPFNLDELVEKHITLVKKCPVVNQEILNVQKGGGDAVNNTSKMCPLPLDIGQDVMGQCPFIANDIQLSSAGKCPFTTSANNNNNNVEKTDKASKPSTSKCPFASMHEKNVPIVVNTTKDVKCPFLLNTIKMFDYTADETPHSQNVIIEDVNDLFCGLYQHGCYSRELYEKCNRLGQELAEELIKKGALDIMKSAQAEIHSKS